MLPPSGSPTQMSIGVCSIAANGSARRMSPSRLREERERHDQAREQMRDGEREQHRAAVVEQPEGAQVDHEADREADDDRDADAEPEREQLERIGGGGHLEQDRAEHELGYRAPDHLVAGAADVLREERALQVDGPVHVGGDVAAADAERELGPARPEAGHDREQPLCKPDVGERVADVVAADVRRLVVDREQDVGDQEAEEDVREEPGGGRPRVRGVAAVTAAGELPVEAHALDSGDGREGDAGPPVRGGAGAARPDRATSSPGSTDTPRTPRASSCWRGSCGT